MPLLPADDQYSKDVYRDAHPLFPRDDVLDVVVGVCNATIQQNKYSLCSMFIRSSSFNTTINALLKLHGGDMAHLSYRVKTPNLFGQHGFILKDTQDSDSSFVRERLASLALRYSGAKVQRECFARLRVAGRTKTVVVEELIDSRFAVSRYGTKAKETEVFVCLFLC
jgi:hypothetical protein